MKPSFLRGKATRGMSLVEVAIAVGLVSFCLVSIMGLFPTMLKAVRESREKALAQRMYQTVTEDLHENPVEAGQNREYTFDAEGFLLTIAPARPGQTFRSGVTRFEGKATNNVTASLPTGSTNESLVLSLIQLTDKERKTTLLQRPVWTTWYD